MNQGTDMLFIQSLAFLEKIYCFNLKVDNYSYCIKPKPKQDKIKSSNIVEKIYVVWSKRMKMTSEDSKVSIFVLASQISSFN